MKQAPIKQTLRWKKTTGILAVILGGFTLIMSLLSINDIIDLAGDIQEIKGQDYYSVYQKELTLKHLTNILHNAYIFIPIIAVTAVALIAFGFVLIAVESDIPHTEKRAKSRRMNMAVICLALVFEIAYVIYYICTSIKFPINIVTDTFTFVLSIAGGMPLIVFSILGLSAVPNALQTQPTAEHSQTVTNPIDTEIITLRNQVQKYKLEKVPETENTKRKEIETLKKELKKLTAKTEASHE